MRIAIGFTGTVVAIVFTKRRQLLQPFVDIRDQPLLSVINVNAGRDVHGGNQNHALANAALCER